MRDNGRGDSQHKSSADFGGSDLFVPKGANRPVFSQSRNKKTERREGYTPRGLNPPLRKDEFIFRSFSPLKFAFFLIVVI
jgi:hypothetical protein